MTTNYGYDDLGRLISVSDTAGTDAEFTYDPAGNRQSVIMSNTDTPGITITNVTGTEANVFLFTVKRTNGLDLVQSVNYATRDGTAVANGDYVSTSGILTFGVGESSQTISVSAIDDTVYELAETFYVDLSDPSNGAILAVATGIGTINDNDALPSLAITGGSETEGNALTFVVTKTGATAVNASATFITANGTATGGNDFQAVNTTVTLAPNETSKNVTVSTLADSIYEGSETFIATLSSPSNATITTAQATGTIVDANAAPQFSLSTNNNNKTFVVTKSGTTAISHAVTLAVTGGTATAGSDYQPFSPMTFTFGPSETFKTFTPTIISDSIYEGDETIVAALQNATGGAAITPAQFTATAIIPETMTPPFFWITGDVNGTEGQNFVFTIIKGGSATALSHAVTYSTASGTAIVGQDLVGQSGTLTFGPNDTSKTITIATIDDTVVENTEYFTLVLSNPTNGATLGPKSSANGLIADNEVVNQAPTPQNDTFAMKACDIGTFNVVANDTDPDGDYPLRVVSISGGGNQAWISGTTSIGWDTLGSHYAGQVRITYVVEDTRGARASAIATINISGVRVCP